MDGKWNIYTIIDFTNLFILPTSLECDVVLMIYVCTYAMKWSIFQKSSVSSAYRIASACIKLIDDAIFGKLDIDKIASPSDFSPDGLASIAPVSPCLVPLWDSSPKSDA